MSRFSSVSIRYLLSFTAFYLICQLPIIQNLDWLLAEWTQSIDSRFLTYGLVPFVSAGSIEISVSGLFLMSFFYYRKKNHERAYLVLAFLLICTGIEFLMKQKFSHHHVPYEFRGRFPWIPVAGSIELETAYSFPSGHSFRSMLFLGLLYVWLVPKQIFFWFLLAYAILQCVGMNYYGFHWLSDCLGGYFLAYIALNLIRKLTGDELQKNPKPHSRVLKRRS